MSEIKILKRVILSLSHKSTGKTEHWFYGKRMPQPYELQIVQYVGDSGFYLFYCDKDGTEMTDTYHDSLELAMEQAEWEFSVRISEWKS